MKINVLFSPGLTEELYYAGKTSVVIDVLRASNTIITALANGAKEIIPVSSVESAVKISKGLFSGSTILGGEKNTRKIDGFNLGNSPFEYSEENVKSKSIVFLSTNGSRAVLKAKFSENLYICGFINIGSVARHINTLNKDLEILCSGSPRAFSMEDTVCAGMLISEIIKRQKDPVLTDSAKASLILFNSVKNISALLKDSDHGRILLQNGFAEDIEYCSKINTTEVIPYLSGNVIKLLPDK